MWENFEDTYIHKRIKKFKVNLEITMTILKVILRILKCSYDNFFKITVSFWKIYEAF